MSSAFNVIYIATLAERVEQCFPIYCKSSHSVQLDSVHALLPNETFHPLYGRFYCDVLFNTTVRATQLEQLI